MNQQPIEAGSPEFEQALAALVAALGQQQPSQPAEMPRHEQDAIAANIERQKGRFYPGLDMRPPPGTDVLGRRRSEVVPHRPGTTEMIANFISGDRRHGTGVNRLMQAAPVIDALPPMAKVAYEGTFVEPGNALFEAAEDPSVATITNAGVRTALAMAPVKPALAMKGTAATMMGGLGTAALMDMAPPLASEAQAADNPQTAQIDSRLKQISTELGRKISNAQRRALETEARDLSAAKAQIIQTQATSAITQTATRQNEQEARRERARNQFATDIGNYEESIKPGATMQTINRLGILAPAAAAAIPGGIMRLAGKSASYGKQYAAGVLPAAVTANAQPLNALYTEPSLNPIRKAYERASLTLDDNDPLKEQYETKAQALPVSNPRWKAAQDDLYDLNKAPLRAGIAALEATAAPAGYEAVSALARTRNLPAALAKETGRIPGSLLEGYNEGMSRARSVKRAEQQSTVDDFINRTLTTANGRLRDPTTNLFISAQEARRIAARSVAQSSVKGQTVPKALVAGGGALAGLGGAYAINRLMAP